MLFSPDFSELLSLDLQEMKKRIAEYKALALQADRVVITIICCDSREVLPEKLVAVRKKNGGAEKVLFITIPTIERSSRNYEAC
jgi:hypothetical protein